MERMEVYRIPLPEDAAEMMGHFGADPYAFTEEEERFLWAAQRQPRFFVLNREEKATGRGWCSTCRAFGEGDPRQIWHKAQIACPHCGSPLVVEHVWRMSKRILDHSLLYQWRRSEAEPGSILCRAVEVHRTWCKTNGRPDLMKKKACVVSFYVYRPGAGGWQLKLTHATWTWKAKRPAPLDGMYEQTGKMWRIVEDEVSLRLAVGGSPLRYGMKEYAKYQRDHFLCFFDWSGRYPSVEKLVKMGLGNLVAWKMVGDGGNAIYWGGKTLERIFRGKLTKADKRCLLQDGNLVTQGVLRVWQFFRGKMSIAEVVRGKEGRSLEGYWWTLSQIARHVDGNKAMAYLKKQGKETWERWPQNIRTYADYLADAAKLSLDFRDKNVLFPKDLFQMHQNTLRQVKYKENAALEAAYAKKRRGEMEKRYSFSAMGMKIVVPEVLADLIAEGKAQHTCVGGYMERVAKGETDVVFVRREGDLDVPYITMEIHDRVIFQARGKNNRVPDEAGKAFIEAFKAAKLTKKEERARATA
ncbi:MAG: PcfJ domain-containing protein [Schwartzia sp. (in: firmicutes)]